MRLPQENANDLVIWASDHDESRKDRLYQKS